MYYPKNKILEGQYTSGREYALKSSNKPYVGYYYITSKNIAYTGKTPNDPNTQELIELKLNNTLISNAIPIPYFPSPTKEDYARGFITRYFIKKRNDSYTTIREISPNDYDNFDDSESLYVKTKINWRLTGDKNIIEETNRKLVGFKEKIFPGFSFWFNSFTQFSK